MELSPALAAAKSELAREINPVMMTPREFSQKASTGDHFVLSLLEEPKTFLVGNAEDLESLAGRWQASRHQTSAQLKVRTVQ